MNPRTLAKVGMLFVVGAAIAALAGCDGGGDGGADSDGPASPTSTGDAHSALVEFTNCMRANGYPSFPLPVEENGQWQIPDSAGNVRPPDVCEQQFRAAKELDAREETREPLSSADMTTLRRFAACMRDNGLPDWPDPDSEGSFSLPERLLPPNQDATMRRAEQACREFEPSNGIRVVDPSAAPG